MFCTVLLRLTPLYGALAAVTTLLGAMLLLLVLGAYLSRTRLWRHIALVHTQTSQRGYLAPQYAQALVGQRGVTQTPLRPAGKVAIEGQTYQATTEGTYLSPQAAVVVTAIVGHTLVVQPHPPA